MSNGGLDLPQDWKVPINQIYICKTVILNLVTLNHLESSPTRAYKRGELFDVLVEGYFWSEFLWRKLLGIYSSLTQREWCGLVFCFLLAFHGAAEMRVFQSEERNLVYLLSD